MNTRVSRMSRRSFLDKVARVSFLAAVGAGALPEKAHARRSRHDEACSFLREHVVADLHVHPSLKTHFFRKHFGYPHPASARTWPFTLRADGPSLTDGHVDAIVSAIYAPEANLIDDCPPLRVLGTVQPSLGRLKKSMKRPPDETAFAMLDSFEAALARKDAVPYARVAKSPADLDAIRSEGKIAVVHSLEGGHSLNGKLDNVDAFHARGVCMITLAHFYDAGVAGNIMGIPYRKSYAAMNCFRNQYGYEGYREGLHPFGRDVAERMIELGMLIDVTHCTEEARKDLYEQAKGRAPVVMSHVGSRELADYRMNPFAEEVRWIADTGGVVGVIFLPFFLHGKHRGKAVDVVVETMDRFIRAGGEDCVAWGSDFDGFTNPPNDLREPSDLPKLVDAMLKRFKPNVVEKIIGGNVRRVLNEGWRPPV